MLPTCCDNISKCKFGFLEVVTKTLHQFTLASHDFSFAVYHSIVFLLSPSIGATNIIRCTWPTGIFVSWALVGLFVYWIIGSLICRFIGLWAHYSWFRLFVAALVRYLFGLKVRCFQVWWYICKKVWIFVGWDLDWFGGSLVRKTGVFFIRRFVGSLGRRFVSLEVRYVKS